MAEKALFELDFQPLFFDTLLEPPSEIGCFCDGRKTHYIWIQLEDVDRRTTSLSSRQSIAFEELLCCSLILKRRKSSSKFYFHVFYR